jgi:hypothetical protein
MGARRSRSTRPRAGVRNDPANGPLGLREGSARPRVCAAVCGLLRLWCKTSPGLSMSRRGQSARPGGGRALPGGAARLDSGRGMSGSSWRAAAASGMAGMSRCGQSQAPHHAQSSLAHSSPGRRSAANGGNPAALGPGLHATEPLARLTPCPSGWCLGRRRSADRAGRLERAMRLAHEIRAGAAITSCSAAAERLLSDGRSERGVRGPRPESRA